MRNVLLTFFAALLLLAGCGKPKAVLNVYNWSEYVDPALITQFEKENNCHVVIDIFNSNEAMLAKIQAGSSGYDVIYPSSYMVKIMENHNLIEKIDKSKIPNLKNIDPAYLDTALDKTMEYGVPYMVTYTGIAYRKDRIQNIDPSWTVFENRPELKGRMTILDDMRETIGAALRYKGHSLNTTNEAELAEARDVVIKWKANIAKFENEQYKTGIAAGEFLLVHGYSGDIGQVQLEDENVGFFLPKEGFSLCCDEMVIPKDAPNKDLAYKFINFLHDGKVAAQNMVYTTYWCPNTAAVEFLPDEVKNNPTIFPKKEDLKRGEVIGYLGPALALYTRTWDEIKAAK